MVFGIVAHVDAGKTTLSEALLYNAGQLKKIGRVDHQDAFFREIVDVRQTTVSFATWSFGVLEIWSFSRIFS